ncbi:hypothetical protein EON67_08650 [archaeon]|nr:MAG: hypothetical protein EON67_08650 [archaeon]
MLSALPAVHARCRLAHTIKRSKWMNIIPWHSKAHPMLRFSSMKPMPTGDAHAPITKPDALDLPVSVSAGADRSLPLSTPAAASLTTALDEISQLTAARPAQA